MTEVKPAKRSIIQMAEQYSVGSTLIMGRVQTGRTTAAIKRIGDRKTLWLSANNLGTISTCDSLGEGSKLVVINDWSQLDTIREETKKGDYQVIVIDGLNNVKDLWFAKYFPNAGTTQADWMKMSKEMARLISDMRDRAVVFAIIDIERTPDVKAADGKMYEGRFDLALNLDAQKRVTGLFDVKLQTQISSIARPNPSTGKVDYTTEFKTIEGAEAFKFN